MLTVPHTQPILNAFIVQILHAGDLKFICKFFETAASEYISAYSESVCESAMQKFAPNFGLYMYPLFTFPYMCSLERNICYLKPWHSICTYNARN